MRVARMRPDTHDRRIALVSHLPHAIAAALVASQRDNSQVLAGPGYRDSTRIAMGDAKLWADILLDNRDNMLHGLESFSNEVALLKSLIQSGDRKTLIAWLTDAAATRKELM
jgi:prephenate dehydrogenase